MNNFELIVRVFQQSPWLALLSIVLVFVPIAIWIFLFFQKHKTHKKTIFVTFVAGICSALIMFFYQYFWETRLDFGFFELTPINFQQNIGAWSANRLLSVFLVAMSIGLIEEYLKHWVVKKSDHKYFRCVNDVIQLSIVAALGFAFTENIIYLFRELVTSGIGPRFFSLFFLRSLFVVFVHVLCSGIYGYYYGIGYYSRPILESEENEGRKAWIPEFLHRLVNWKKERVFHDEMIVAGLLISVVVHGLFDFFMSVNWTLGSLLQIPALERVGIHILVLPLYLILGFWYIMHLFQKKQHYERFGQVKVKTVYVEHDLKKNLASMENMERSIQENYRRKKEDPGHNLQKNLKMMEEIEHIVAKRHQKESN